MTTTDTDALQERVAEELYYEQHPEVRHRSEWPAAVYPDTVYEYRDLAAAVLPIVREAQADALRGAAESMNDDLDYSYLIERACQYEQEADQ